MSDINNFTFIGNLTKDAEIKQNKNGNNYIYFSVANNVGYGDNEFTNFFNCVYYPKNTDSVINILRKGLKVAIVSEVRQYIGKDEKRVTGYNIKNIQFLSSSKKDNTNNTNKVENNNKQLDIEKQLKEDNEYLNPQGFDDDIPF